MSLQTNTHVDAISIEKIVDMAEIDDGSKVSSLRDENDIDIEMDNDQLLEKKGLLGSSAANSSAAGVIPVVTLSGKSARLQALSYVAFAAFNFSLMSMCIKHSTRYMTSHETVFWRTSLSWIINMALVRYHKVPLHVPQKHRKLLLFRSLVGFVGMSLQFYAMSRMVLTDAVVIIFTSPVVTFILGALVLKEAIDRTDFLCALSSYLGVLFVARPPFLFASSATATSTTSAPVAAVLAALGGACTQAIAYVCMKKLHDVHHLVIIHYFLMFSTTFAVLMLLYLNVNIVGPVNTGVFFSIVGSGVFSCVGQLYMTKGFQKEKVGIASVMRYLDVVFVFIWDVAILGESVHGYSLLGGSIICASAVIIALRKARRDSDK